ncbi:MAG: S-methyl-5-thioribose-1-phosphate isomerase [Candidatus Gastranaerophilales bacterium]|nr:S-methyl-5-thioribose-1-phosphate isomerase [Candidatus Gastranaerophilales bacterium]
MALKSNIKPVALLDKSLILIDQTLLPYEYKSVELKTYKDVANAIKTMVVRGAPAIGISGAHGFTLGAIENKKERNMNVFLDKMSDIAQYLISQRPTAVNLEWAVNKQMTFAKANSNLPVEDLVKKIWENSKKLELEDIDINIKIGDNGAAIIPKGATILTHCNAGALATVGYGTALGVVRSAFEKDKTIQVFADETRPRQQGARLTTWELIEDNIPTTLITDGMCGYFMKKGMIDVVVVGADRIAANGDTANKIGTYTVALAAKAHKVPFYIAAPLSTIDTTIQSGDEIEIEERDPMEVTHINGKTICAQGVNIINPSFDVTPNELIAGIITEKGILKSDYKKSIKNAFKQM